jgi:hypothetical protein
MKMAISLAERGGNCQIKGERYLNHILSASADRVKLGE